MLLRVFRPGQPQLYYMPLLHQRTGRAVNEILGDVLRLRMTLCYKAMLVLTAWVGDAR